MKSLLSRAELPSTNVASCAPRMSAENESRTSTIPATPRAVDVPDSIATAMSAARNACTSLAPSPTIATKRPCSRRTSTMRLFCCGQMRPKMLCDSTASANASAESLSRSGPEIAPPGVTMRSCWSSAATVCGLSPLMIFGSMPSCSISRNASFTSGRSTSPMVISASGRTFTSGASGSGSAVTSANATPRRPLALADS